LCGSLDRQLLSVRADRVALAAAQERCDLGELPGVEAVQVHVLVQFGDWYRLDGGRAEHRRVRWL
jgi:hypothetical protein